MNRFLLKLRLIFLPFAIVSVSTIGIYTFFNWLLFVRYNALNIDDEIINLMIPIGLPWVPLLIWIRPRIKLLTLNNIGRKDPVTQFLLLCWIIIVTPLIISQNYMITATGKLTRLDRISQISTLPATKYYIVKQLYINKRMVHVTRVFEVRGKHNEDFNMSLYGAVPIFDYAPDTGLIYTIKQAHSQSLVILNSKVSTIDSLSKIPADSIRMMRYLNPTLVMPRYGELGKNGALLVITYGYQLKKGWKMSPHKISPAAWVTAKYSKTISNSLSIKEKNQAFKLFAKNTQANFDKKIFRFVYLDKLPFNSKELLNYRAAILQKGDVAILNNKPLVVFNAVNEPFEKHNGNKLLWIFGWFIAGSGIFLLILYFKRLKDY